MDVERVAPRAGREHTEVIAHHEVGMSHAGADMRIEVARAKWIPLDDAPKLLAYSGEKQMARKALEYLKAHPEL